MQSSRRALFGLPLFGALAVAAPAIAKTAVARPLKARGDLMLRTSSISVSNASVQTLNLATSAPKIKHLHVMTEQEEVIAHGLNTWDIFVQGYLEDGRLVMMPEVHPQDEHTVKISLAAKPESPIRFVIRAL